MKPVCLTNELEWHYSFEGSSSLLPPDTTENGLWIWEWKTLWDAPLELSCSLPCEGYVGCVTVTLERGISAARVSVDGKPAGAVNGGTSLLSGTVEIPVGVHGREISLVLEAAMEGVAVCPPRIYCALEEGHAALWPSPSHIMPEEDRLPFEALAAPAGEDEDSRFAAANLCDRLSERGMTPAFCGTKPFLLKKNPCLAPDSYRLKIGPGGILAEGGDRRGFLYAAERLLQLADRNGFVMAEVDDVPFLPMRGFHMGLPPREELDFARRLIRTVLMPLHYNQLYVEFAGGMRFESHPEISEAWVKGNIAGEQGLQPPFPHGEKVAGGRLLEKDEVRDFLDYARAYGLEIIPEVQTWGHTQYITYAHPELAETEAMDTDAADTRNADQRTSRFYSHCFCPSDERSYAIIEDILEEILEVARPERFVHMGHDEIYDIGLCPRCKGKNHAELYLQDINRLHAYLRRKGLKMMIWSDMLQPLSGYQTVPAADQLPKDIVFLDFTWYFWPEEEIEDHLLPLGNPMMIGNLYSSHYPRYESRIRKGLLGGEVSTWCRIDERNLGEFGKLYDLVYTAEMLCSENYAHEYRRVYTHLLSEEILPRLKEDLTGRKTPSLHFAAEGENTAIPSGLLRICPEAVQADGASIRVGGKLQSLHLIHTVMHRRPADFKLGKSGSHVIGTFTLHYSDGTSAELSSVYARDVLSFDARWAEPLPYKVYRHYGYVCTWFAEPALEAKGEHGEDLLLLRAEWQNPYPDKAIDTVTFCENPLEKSGWILAGMDGTPV